MSLFRNQIGGYTFPKDNASRKRFVTAVKRVSGGNKPWSTMSSANCTLVYIYTGMFPVGTPALGH